MQKIAILYDASQAVLSTFDLDEVFQHILRIMRDYFQLEHSSILLLDRKTGELEARSISSDVAGGFGSRTRLGEGLIGAAAKLKRPVYSNDVSKDPRYICAFPSTCSELAIPLMLRDDVVGVLDCQSDRPDFFDNETTDLLMLFSTQASIAIQNAQLYALEQRRAKQLEAINTIARHTTEVTDIRKLLDKVALQIFESFRPDEVSVLLFENGLPNLPVLLIEPHRQATGSFQIKDSLDPAATSLTLTLKEYGEQGREFTLTLFKIEPEAGVSPSSGASP